MTIDNKKTKITFHSGILTIGGTIIEVAHEDSHIFFDFGSEYNPKAEVQPTNLQELLDAKMVPYLNNIYDPSIPLTGYQSQPDQFNNTAVFLSHVHLDHSKIINYLHPQIPLYTLRGTKSLLNTLNINNDFLFPLHHQESSNTREIIGVEENATVEVGQIRVTLMPVDHDAYGACGLLIQTPDLKIAYSGDLRLHGYRKNDTLAFCEASQYCDVLIIEGVSVSFQDFDEPEQEAERCSEQKVIERINDIVIAHPEKQITFNYYISNIERVLHMIKTNPRIVVLEAHSAYVVKEATGFTPHYYQLDDVDYGLDKNYQIGLEELLNDEGCYFWQLGSQAMEYMDKMKRGGIYIHSNATPLGEYDPAYRSFIEQFEHHEILLIKVLCSGHAHPNDLMRIIDQIKPKLLIPIHSYHPEKLYNQYGAVLLPERNQTI